ncbi:MAG TPA: hypothetical protein VLL51_01215 [Gemmatimonadales bacterium]|nr:hypothetical protein [Gemmatimonadales bacterium]
MTPEQRRALAAVADRISAYRHVLGGSAMLEAHGIPVEVGDLDLVMEPAARAVLDPPPWASAGPVEAREPFCSEWIFRFEVGGVRVDCIGVMRIRCEGRVVELPLRSLGSIEVEGRRVPLADPADWYHLYRYYRADRAEAIAAVWDPAELAAAAVRLGLAAEIG